MNGTFKTACVAASLIGSVLVSGASFAETTMLDKTGTSIEANAESFAQKSGSKGVVLFDAKWGRQWKCAGFENAQLVGFAFDRMPLPGQKDDAAADISVEENNRLFVKPEFISYAILVEPGEYALSGFKIKVARSVSDVGYFSAKRSNLLKDGSSLGGSFKLAAGEAVYIGNFALDCYQQPVLWRYYTIGTAGFQKHAADYKSKYPFLEPVKITYRLFDTKLLGRAYELK